MTTFIDTSALLALLDRNDEHHVDATAAWAVLASQEADLVTTNYVVLETLAVTQHRLGLDAVRGWVHEVLPLLDVVFVDGPVHEAALASMLAAGRRHLSLVDCVSFEIIRRMRLCPRSHDKHFDEQGFSPPEHHSRIVPAQHALTRPARRAATGTTCFILS